MLSVQLPHQLNVPEFTQTVLYLGNFFTAKGKSALVHDYVNVVQSVDVVIEMCYTRYNVKKAVIKVVLILSLCSYNELGDARARP